MSTFCAHFNESVCRSCALLPVEYDQQIAHKEKKLRVILPPDCLVLPAVTSSTRGFRNKAKLVVSGTLSDPVLGLVDREILDCPVHHPEINRLQRALIPFIKLARLEPYRISEKKGELKGVIIFHGDETYLRFVLRSRESLDRIRKHLPNLLEEFPKLRSVSVNVQPIHQAILEGEEEIPLGPESFITQSFGELALRIRPQGFIQTNLEVATRLYEAASAWVKDTGARRMLELFCGQGAFSFHCASSMDSVIGVEINPEAVAMANETARENALSHLEFIALDAAASGELLRMRAPDLVLVNPPRRGLAETCELLLANSPDWVVYSSCSVESLATDLKKLGPAYAVIQAQIFDMFPHTEHFETLVLLRKR